MCSNLERSCWRGLGQSAYRTPVPGKAKVFTARITMNVKLA
ncbi:hypothetical protein [Pseudomonas vanderleydeniana]|nr:hypothetical protein [Pseudomonas vanderleydeniana]